MIDFAQSGEFNQIDFIKDSDAVRNSTEVSVAGRATAVWCRSRIWGQASRGLQVPGRREGHVHQTALLCDIHNCYRGSVTCVCWLVEPFS